MCKVTRNATHDTPVTKPPSHFQIDCARAMASAPLSEPPLSDKEMAASTMYQLAKRSRVDALMVKKKIIAAKLRLVIDSPQEELDKMVERTIYSPDLSLSMECIVRTNDEEAADLVAKLESLTTDQWLQLARDWVCYHSGICLAMDSKMNIAYFLGKLRESGRVVEPSCKSVKNLLRQAIEIADEQLFWHLDVTNLGFTALPPTENWPTVARELKALQQYEPCMFNSMIFFAKKRPGMWTSTMLAHPKLRIGPCVWTVYPIMLLFVDSFYLDEWKFSYRYAQITSECAELGDVMWNLLRDLVRSACTQEFVAYAKDNSVLRVEVLDD